MNRGSKIRDLLERLAASAETEAAKLTPLLASEIESALAATSSLRRAHSGSWIGYQSRCYLRDFEAASAGEHFDSMSRGLTFNDTTVGDWVEYGEEEIVAEWLARSRLSLKKLKRLERVRREVVQQLRQQRAQSLAALQALGDHPGVTEVAERVKQRSLPPEPLEITKQIRPKSVQSRDRRAMMSGVSTPTHLRLASGPLAARLAIQACTNLAADMREACAVLELSELIAGEETMTSPTKSKTVFIGHGRSQAWRDLKDLLVERLGLSYIEFNSDPTAGFATKERLEEMLEKAAFAFLVLTAEDEQPDGTYRARENVVHESGLFQGRLGFRRAILLVEEGCAEFSNIVGLTQIRFPKGNVRAKSEEIRGVLEREGILTR